MRNIITPEKQKKLREEKLEKTKRVGKTKLITTGVLISMCSLASALDIGFLLLGQTGYGLLFAGTTKLKYGAFGKDHNENDFLVIKKIMIFMLGISLLAMFILPSMLATCVCAVAAISSLIQLRYFKKCGYDLKKF